MTRGRPPANVQKAFEILSVTSQEELNPDNNLMSQHGSGLASGTLLDETSDGTDNLGTAS